MSAISCLSVRYESCRCSSLTHQQYCSTSEISIMRRETKKPHSSQNHFCIRSWGKKTRELCSLRSTTSSVRLELIQGVSNESQACWVQEIACHRGRSVSGAGREGIVNWEGYESGPFCRHWRDPTDCCARCTCGHDCTRHEFSAPGKCLECDCKEWNEASQSGAITRRP